MRRRRAILSWSTINCSALTPVIRARRLEIVRPAFEKTRSDVKLVAGIAGRYLAPRATRGKCCSFSRPQSSAVSCDSGPTARPRYAFHSASRENVGCMWEWWTYRRQWAEWVSQLHQPQPVLRSGDAQGAPSRSVRGDKRRRGDWFEPRRRWLRVPAVQQCFGLLVSCTCRS